MSVLNALIKRETELAHKNQLTENVFIPDKVLKAM